ncbi:hypothetical protein G5714_023465 [Onychostoma macrolepis]|uniref:Uncharacterized protein n=1 Tax=Onychostoma macrolepis TaxID=369639 RepID=A0A7J6BQD4_9TELE|nr:hypothetical protein G5714_023465 [Onychostoma macrolepis]
MLCYAIKECGGGHIQFDQRQPGCYSEIIQRVEKVKDEYEEFLKREVFDDAEERISASVVRVEVEEEGNKKGNDGGGFLQFFLVKVDRSSLPELVLPNPLFNQPTTTYLVDCGDLITKTWQPSATAQRQMRTA